jgi:hypothetical protein
MIRVISSISEPSIAKLVRLGAEVHVNLAGGQIGTRAMITVKWG